MKESIQPLGDRVIIKSPEEGETKSKRGKVLLHETATRGQVMWGEVFRVGPGIYTQTGDLIPTSVRVGDSVMYKKDMVGDKIKIEDEEYIMFREHDLLMVDSNTPTPNITQLLNDSSPINTFKGEY